MVVQNCPQDIALPALHTWCGKVAADRDQGFTAHVYGCDSCTRNVAQYFRDQGGGLSGGSRGLKGPTLVVGIVVFGFLGALTLGTFGELISPPGGAEDSASLAAKRSADSEVNDPQPQPEVGQSVAVASPPLAQDSADQPAWAADKFWNQPVDTWTPQQRIHFLTSDYFGDGGGETLTSLLNEARRQKNPDMVVRALRWAKDPFRDAKGNINDSSLASAAYLEVFSAEDLEAACKRHADSAPHLRVPSNSRMSKADAALLLLKEYLSGRRNDSREN